MSAFSGLNYSIPMDERQKFMNKIDYHRRLWAMQGELGKYVYDPKGQYQAPRQLREWVQTLTGAPVNQVNQFLAGRVVNWDLLEKCEEKIREILAE